MLRFIDLTAAYWLDAEDEQKCCAWIDTVSDTFVPLADGTHICMSVEDVELLPAHYRERAEKLIPEGFWQRDAHVRGE